MVKNESLYTGVKTATTEMHKNEAQLRENEILIEQLKALTKSQEIMILECESKIKRLEKNLATNDLPQIEVFNENDDVSPKFLRPNQSSSCIGIANNLRSSIRLSKQRRSGMNLSIYSAANFSDPAKLSVLKRKSTIQNRAARALSFLDFNFHDEEKSAMKEKPAENFYQFARRLTMWNQRESIKELKSREDHTHSKASLSVSFHTDSDGIDSYDL